MKVIRIALLIAVCCFLFAAAYLSNLISQGHFALEQAARYNIVWAINQALVELTRLEQAIGNAAAFGGGQRDVDLRYQILLGRADVLRQGESAEFVRQNADYLTIMEDLERALAEAEPLLERFDAPGSADQLIEILSPLDTRLAHLASSARQFGDELNAHDQMRLRRLHFLYTWVAVALLVCGLALIGLLTWNNRLLARAHGNLRSLADELSSVSDAQTIQNLRFQAALKNLSQGLCMVDSAGHLVVCNDRFREMFGISADAPGLEPTPDHLMAKSTNRPSAKALREIYPRQEIAIREGRSDSFVEEQPGGYAFSVHHVALADGGWLATYEDITDRRRTELQIVRMAHHDSLTDLANRALFNETLEKVLSALGTDDQSLAILFLDLDGFKDVNDTLGHQVGDEILRAVAARLRSCVRPGDLIARLGGDEFGILLPADEALDCASVASRIIDCLGEPYVVEGHEIVIGVSIGIAEAAGDRWGPEELLRHADLALYDVKTSGKGTFRFFEKSLDDRLQERKNLEADLRKAVSNGELEVHYQPSIDATHGRVSGFEALARWRHPTRGMVPPDQFIPIAEETALIVTIGEWVLRQACFAASSWPADVRIAVNISAHQFRDPNFLEKVSDALLESGLDPSRLELEITETVLLEHSEGNTSVLHALRRSGVRIAMDDFGTGYSSLSYLIGFPFDKIKIDRSFVERLPESADSGAVVQLVCHLGNKLGITTVAEGVETQAQLEFLKSAGCKEIQGFFFSRPLPEGDVVSFIAGSGSQGKSPQHGRISIVR